MKPFFLLRNALSQRPIDRMGKPRLSSTRNISVPTARSLDDGDMITSHGGSSLGQRILMQNSPVKIDVSIGKQELKLRAGGKIIRRYPVSSSRFGLGTQPGTNKTPLENFALAERNRAAGNLQRATLVVGHINDKGRLKEKARPTMRPGLRLKPSAIGLANWSLFCGTLGRRHLLLF